MMMMDSSVKMEADMVEEFPCTECDKKFRSWKALFGHMRCHPDRVHRGMLNYFRTPAAAEEPTTSDVDDHEVADCLLMLANGAFDPRESSRSADKLVSDKNDKGKAVVMMTTSTPTMITSSSSGGGGGLVIRHKCSKCLRVFSSGQALGGPKRSCLQHHCKVEGSSSSHPPATATATATRVVVNLGFDLNSCPVLLVQGNNNDDHHDSNYSALDLELRL